jgi:phospholipase D1/2
VNPTENGGLYPLHLLEWPFFSQGIFSDINARKCTPRLPNCQVMIAVLGSVATDLARTFVCQWNACPLNQKPDEPGTISQRMIFDLPTVIPGMDEATFRWVLEQNDPLAIVGLCNARCLRSLSPSYGFANIEASIHDQMLHLISTADRSIHLECSTFISFVTPQNFVHNRIARALFDRISIAIEQDQDFFVVIQLPVQPPALIEKLSTLGEIFFSAMSLHHSKDSLLGQLQERYFTIPDNDSDVNNPLSRRSAKGKRITDYLSILTLYKWVHFKDRYKYTGFKKASPMRPANHVACGINVTGTVLIVDDKVALIGSHGVSDRSLLGNRNSESAIVVDDKEIKSITSGFRSDTSVEVGVNVHKFRMRLWNRLLGLPLNDMTTTSNMIAQEVRLLLKHTAKRNTVLFHHVFPALPHHSYRTLQDFNMAILKKRERRPNEQQSTLFLHEIKGVVCHFPVGFLADEDPEGVIGSFGDSLSKTQRQYV